MGRSAGRETAAKAQLGALTFNTWLKPSEVFPGLRLCRILWKLVSAQDVAIAAAWPALSGSGIMVAHNPKPVAGN